MVVPVKVVGLVSVWVETVIYGSYVIIYFESMYLMYLHRQARRTLSSFYMIAATLMFMVESAHMAVGLYRLLKGYVWGVSPLPVHQYFSPSTVYDHWEHRLYVVLGTVMAWVVELTIISRCYSLLGKKRWIAYFPTFIYLICIVLHVPIITGWVKQFPKNHPIARSTKATYPVQVLQNTITSSLLVSCLIPEYRQAKSRDDSLGNKAAGAARLVFESALPYTFLLVLLMMMFYLEHPAQLILLSAETPTVGITFNVIILRFQTSTWRTRRSSGVADNSIHQDVHSTGTIGRSLSAPTSRSLANTRTSHGEYPLESLVPTLSYGKQRKLATADAYTPPSKRSSKSLTRSKASSVGPGG